MAAPPGFNDLIQRKYDIQQQQVDASSNLQNVQAGQLPADSAARRALEGAQAYQTTQQGNTLQPLADASIRSQAANSQEALSRSGYYGALGQQAQHSLTPATGFDLTRTANELGYANEASGPLSVQPRAGGGLEGSQGGAAPQPGAGLFGPREAGITLSGGGYGLNKGTDQVPGVDQGHDTVPAMLTPGEAVLNHGAAEHLGRGLISVLNAIGEHNAERGLSGVSAPQANAGTQAPVMGNKSQATSQGFNKGTSFAKLPEDQGMGPSPAPATGGNPAPKKGGMPPPSLKKMDKRQA